MIRVHPIGLCIAACALSGMTAHANGVRNPDMSQPVTAWKREMDPFCTRFGADGNCEQEIDCIDSVQIAPAAGRSVVMMLRPRWIMQRGDQNANCGVPDCTDPDLSVLHIVRTPALQDGITLASDPVANLQFDAWCEPLADHPCQRVLPAADNLAVLRASVIERDSEGNIVGATSWDIGAAEITHRWKRFSLNYTRALPACDGVYEVRFELPRHQNPMMGPTLLPYQATVAIDRVSLEAGCQVATACPTPAGRIDFDVLQNRPNMPLPVMSAAHDADAEWACVLDAQSCRPCLGDIDGDRAVGGSDLGLLLGDWGGTCLDIDGDGQVTGGDLGLLLGSWGLCP